MIIVRRVTKLTQAESKKKKYPQWPVAIDLRK